MPYKSEYSHLIIPKDKNMTRKLSDEDREKIKELYGKVSQRKLAKAFGVSRRLVIYIGCPDKYEKSKEQRRKRRYFYPKAKINQYKQKTRKYRQELYLKGELEVKNARTNQC